MATIATPTAILRGAVIVSATAMAAPAFGMDTHAADDKRDAQKLQRRTGRDDRSMVVDDDIAAMTAFAAIPVTVIAVAAIAAGREGVHAKPIIRSDLRIRVQAEADRSRIGAGSAIAAIAGPTTARRVAVRGLMRVFHPAPIAVDHGLALRNRQVIAPGNSGQGQRCRRQQQQSERVPKILGNQAGCPDRRHGRTRRFSAHIPPRAAPRAATQVFETLSLK